MSLRESPFQLSDTWMRLGIVTPEVLHAMREEWARGLDPYPEHYRWRAFTAFLKGRQPIDPTLAIALYELGSQDPDAAMGASMMHTIVGLPECPENLLDIAAASGRSDLVRLVARRRREAGGPAPDSETAV